MKLSDIRKNARNALKGKWGIAIIASIIASVCGASSMGSSPDFELDLSDSSSEDTLALDGILADLGISTEEFLTGFLTFVGIFAVIGLVVGAVFFCLGSIVSLGYQKFNLDLVDGKDVSIGTLFTYFKHWKNAILSNLLVTVYVFLWSLLLVIPGIIAGYGYSMVPFILAEDPELSPSQALQRSKEMMKGHKMQLFLLNLSFIGWSILCVLTLGIGFIWLTPYMNASLADFYREISETRPRYSEFGAYDNYGDIAC